MDGCLRNPGPRCVGVGTHRINEMLGGVLGCDSSLGLTAATTAVPPASLLPSAGAPAFIYCAKDNASFLLFREHLPSGVGREGWG